MKRKFKFISLPLLAIAGLCTAVALAHVGSGSVTCNTATSSYVDFPNANNNTVQEQVLVDGVTVYNQPFSFNGPTGGHTIALSITGNHTVQLKGTWTAASANGEAGSFTSQPVLVSCSTVTVTVTNTVSTTITQPGTTVTTTQTQPGVTVHDTTTQVTTQVSTQVSTQVENHTNTVHDTVTQTLPAVTATTTLPGKTTTVNHTTTVIRRVPRKLTPKQRCLLSGGIWNGHNCGFKGTG